MTTEQVAARFDELAQKEMWFEIHDELFADHVKSIEPTHAVHLGYAEGKANVRKKGMGFVAKITEFHNGSTTQPVVAGNHFAVGRKMDVTVAGIGRMQMDEVMLYEVRDGAIVMEQFFY